MDWWEDADWPNDGSRNEPSKEALFILCLVSQLCYSIALHAFDGLVPRPLPTGTSLTLPVEISATRKAPLNLCPTASVRKRDHHRPYPEGYAFGKPHNL